jgi:3-deoxy-D-manno-octulosonic-acid transferase
MNLLDLIYVPIGVLTAPFWARKKRGGWHERFGRIQEMMRRGPGGEQIRVLLHAVSVGEVNALRTLVDRLNQDERVGMVIISTTTDTGLARARELFEDTCTVVRYPLDCSWMVRRFFDSVRPDVIGLVELEVWPNFIKCAAKRRVPVCVINGRLSARSFKGYRKIRFLLKRTFERLAVCCVQDEEYAERFRAMGARDVRVTDSMKWDSVDVTRVADGPSDRAYSIALEMGLDLTRPILVAGSTASGEEALMHASCPDGAQLVCAPRKPERFDEAAAAIPGCVRRSAQIPAPSGTNRYLLDTIGELSAIYELADVVVVGRSFGDLYGSDPIEPAAMGKPVVIGPSHSDFATAVRALQQSEGIIVVDREQLRDELVRLFRRPATGVSLGERAQSCVRAHQGATDRHHELLVDLGRDRPKGR